MEHCQMNMVTNDYHYFRHWKRVTNIKQFDYWFVYAELFLMPLKAQTVSVLHWFRNTTKLWNHDNIHEKNLTLIYVLRFIDEIVMNLKKDFVHLELLDHRFLQIHWFFKPLHMCQLLSIGDLHVWHFHR